MRDCLVTPQHVQVLVITGYTRYRPDAQSHHALTRGRNAMRAGAPGRVAPVRADRGHRRAAPDQGMCHVRAGAPGGVAPVRADRGHGRGAPGRLPRPGRVQVPLQARPPPEAACTTRWRTPAWRPRPCSTATRASRYVHAPGFQDSGLRFRGAWEQARSYAAEGTNRVSRCQL